MGDLLDLSVLDLPYPEYLTREEIISIEYNEIKNGKSALELMQAAGDRITELVTSHYAAQTILIFAGPGNNGGDGYVAAEKLSETKSVKVCYVDKPKTKTSRSVFDRLDMQKIELIQWTPELDLEDLIDKSDIIIDALFGIGIKSQLREPYSGIISEIKKFQSTKNIVAVDLPSGLDCNSFTWYGPEYLPDVIISMQFSKLVFKNMKDIRIEIVDIGFSLESVFLVGPGQVKTYWEPRVSNSYKGQNGRVMVIGGSDEFTGAPVLSGKAVLRSGVDTLRIAVPETIRDIVAGYNQDFIVIKIAGERHTSKSFSKFIDMTRNRHDVVVIGMGLSNHNDTQKFVRELMPKIADRVKVVLDADAIRPYADHLEDLSKYGAIITPHRAELRVVLGEQIPPFSSQLMEFLMTSARDNNLVILLKGEIDVITDGRRIFLNNTGHAGMTVGGTGDVLAGVVAATNCFVNDKFYATAIAAYIMGTAGELAGTEFGISLLATDIIENLPKILLQHNVQ